MKSTPRTAAFASAATAAATAGPSGFVARVAAFPRLVRDVMLGRYHGVSRGRIALMGLAVLYIVSPIDLLPEAILTIPGLADDAMVGAWLVAAVLGAGEGYLAWAGSQVPFAGGAPMSPYTHARTVPGQVVTAERSAAGTATP